jgi:hypothetical protein
MTKVILITGAKQSGKDSLAGFLHQAISLKKGWQMTSENIKTYSFATPLKNYLIDVMGLTYDQCWGTDNDKNSETNIRWGDLPLDGEETYNLFCESRSKELADSLFWQNLPMTAREVMQVFGTNICRKMVANCFAGWAKKQIIKDNPKIAFITDCRFPDELEIFKDMDNIVIRLLRNKFNSRHKSEIALNDYDFSKAIIIDNSEMSIEEKNSEAWSKVKDLI